MEEKWRLDSCCLNRNRPVFILTHFEIFRYIFSTHTYNNNACIAMQYFDWLYYILHALHCFAALWLCAVITTLSCEHCYNSITRQCRENGSPTVSGKRLSDTVGRKWNRRVNKFYLALLHMFALYGKHGISYNYEHAVSAARVRLLFWVSSFRFRSQWSSLISKFTNWKFMFFAMTKNDTYLQ